VSRPPLAPTENHHRQTRPPRLSRSSMVRKGVCYESTRPSPIHYQRRCSDCGAVISPDRCRRCGQPHCGPADPDAVTDATASASEPNPNLDKVSHANQCAGAGRLLSISVAMRRSRLGHDLY
jgi:predicted amidophosphoribosyltransferase